MPTSASAVATTENPISSRIANVRGASDSRRICSIVVAALDRRGGIDRVHLAPDERHSRARIAERCAPPGASRTRRSARTEVDLGLGAWLNASVRVSATTPTIVDVTLRIARELHLLSERIAAGKYGRRAPG